MKVSVIGARVTIESFHYTSLSIEAIEGAGMSRERMLCRACRTLLSHVRSTSMAFGHMCSSALQISVVVVTMFELMAIDTTVSML